MERVRSEPSVGRLSSTEPNSSGESVGCMFGGDFRRGCKSRRLGIRVNISDIEEKRLVDIFFSFLFLLLVLISMNILVVNLFPDGLESLVTGQLPCNGLQDALPCQTLVHHGRFRIITPGYWNIVI